MRLRRVILGTVLVLGFLVLLVAGTVWWVFSTDAGSRRALAFVMGKTPEGLEIESVRGPLRGPLYLHGIRYRSGGLSAEIDTVMLDVRPRELLSGRLVFERVSVTGMRVVLPDSAPPDSGGTGRARREAPGTPIPVVVEEGHLSGIDVDAPGDVMIRDGAGTISGNLDDYRFEIRGRAIVPQVDTTMLVVGGTGNQEAVRVDSTSRVTLLGAHVAATGVVRWWPMIEWDLRVGVDSLQPSRFVPNPELVPGLIRLVGETRGRMDSTGPAGLLQIDSLTGRLRDQPIEGRASLQFSRTEFRDSDLDVQWGSARVRAAGDLGTRVDLTYDVAVADLRTVNSSTRGRLDLKGRLSGPLRSPRIESEVAGQGIQTGGVQLSRLAGRVDVDLTPGGRTIADLRGDSLLVSNRRFDHFTFDLRGVSHQHQATLLATAPFDTVRLALNGGIRRQTWRGTVSDLAILTEADWRLDQPVQLVVSPDSGRLERLCLTADSAAGQACAEATWSDARRWRVTAEVAEADLQRLPLQLPLGYTMDQLRGVLRLRLDAENTASGMVANLDTRIRDTTGERVTLTGRLTLPGYWLGRPLERQPLLLGVEGRMDTLSVLAPLFRGVDSLAGSASFQLTGSGTVGAPRLESRLRVEQVVARMRERRRLTGALDATASVQVQPGGAMQGEARLVPVGLELEYQPFRGLIERVRADSGGLVLTAGADGVRGRLDLTLRNAAGDSLLGIGGELALPRYTRWRQPLAPQPVSLRLALETVDLAVLQPFFVTVDSLGGTIKLSLEAQGTVGMPDLKGTLLVENGVLQTAARTQLRGGLNGTMDMTVSRDSSISGSLRIEPKDVRFIYATGDTVEHVTMRDTRLEVRAGREGVQGTLDLTFAADGDSTLGTFRARGGLPRYTRFGRPLADQPVELTLEGRIDDFAFLPVFLSVVDSAAGRGNVDARLTGTLSDSRLVGEAVLQDVTARLPSLGIMLDDMEFTARGDQRGVIQVEGRVRSGGGELVLTGSTPTQPTRASPGRLQLRGENFLVSNSAEAEALISPRLDITLIGDTIGVRGQVDIPLARIELTEMPQATIKPSDDVILLNSSDDDRRGRPIVAEVRMVLGDSVSFRGFNFDAELGGALLLVERPERPAQATGTLVIEEGRYKAYGQDLTVTNGTLRFAGPLDNPALNIRAGRLTSDSINVGLAMTGTLKEPDVRLYSDHPMAQAQILSYMVTGGPVGGAGSAGNLINKALSTLGLSGGSRLAGAVGEDLGLDNVRLETTGDLQDASLVLGRYLSPNVYISYGVGLFDPVSTLRLRYVLSSKFSIQAEAGGKATGGDALFRIRK